MKVFLITATAALAAALAGLPQSTAGAASPVTVELRLFPTQFCCPELGTWEMVVSGVATDTGTFARTEFHATGSLPDFFAPEHSGAFQEVFVLTSARGTLTIRDQTLLTTTNVSGPWEIAAGTGAYDRTSGHGTLAFSVLPGPVFLFDLTGVISKLD